MSRSTVLFNRALYPNSQSLRVTRATSNYNVSLRFVETSTQPAEDVEAHNEDSEVVPELSDRSQRIRNKISSTALEQKFYRLTRDLERYGRIDKFTLSNAMEAFKDAAANDDPANPSVNLSTFGQMLLRSCGGLLSEIHPREREAFAGEIWTCLKDHKIRLDISHYNTLLKVFIQNDTEFDPLKVLKEINDLQIKPNRVTFQLMIHRYCLAGDIEGATKILEHMKEQSMEINESVFASLIIGYGKMKQMDAARGIIDIMRSSGLEPSSKTYSALVAATLFQGPLDEARTNECRSLVQQANQTDLRLSDRDYFEIIQHVASADQTSPLIQELLDQAPRSQNYNPEGVRLILNLIHHGHYQAASNVFWSMKPSNTLLEAKRVGGFYIRALASVRQAAPVDLILEECEKLEAKDLCLNPFHILYYNSFVNGNIASGRAALDKIKSRQKVKPHFYWPLLAQAPDTEAMLNVLKNDVCPSVAPQELSDTLSRWVWPRLDPDQVVNLIKELAESGHDAHQIVVSYFESLSNDQNVERAIDFLKTDFARTLFEQSKDNDAPDSNNPETIHSTRAQSDNVNRDYMARLLNQIAVKTLNPDLVREAFQLTIKNVTAFSARPLVRVHILRGQYKDAVDELLNLADRYSVTPMKMELMKYCVTEKDSESLQKIVDASTRIYGELNALFDLAVACLHCGQAKQARKIFTNPNFRLSQDRMDKFCENLVQNENLSTLENLFHSTRDIYGIDRDRLYHALLRAYAKVRDGQRALNLWTLMQEEDHQPSRRTLWYLATVLEENGINPPFEKPDLLGVEAKKAGQPKRPVNESPVMELEEFLEKAPTIKPFPLGTLLQMLKTKPEHESELVELCNKMVDEDYHLPMNMLWIYLMNSKRFDEAEKVFSKHLRHRSPILFAGVIDKIMTEQNVDMCQKLLDMVGSTDLAPRSKGNVASTMLHVLTDLDKLEEAERFVKEDIVKYGITPEDMNRRSLLKTANKIRERFGRELETASQE